MKKYIGIESANSKKGVFDITIYRIKNNELIYISMGKINYSITMGRREEVMNVLVDLGEIPKKYKNTYYFATDKKNFKIDYIIPLKK